MNVRNGLFRRRLAGIDWGLLAVSVFLVLIGFVVIISASRGGVREIEDSLHFFRRQLVWGLVGFAAVFGLAQADYRRVKPYASVLYWVSVVSLVAVLIFGEQRLGAQRWLLIGSFTIQPSEYAKLFLTLFFAAFFSEVTGPGLSWRDLGRAFVYLSLPVALVFLQPDLGTAVVLIAMMYGMMVWRGATLKHFAVVTSILLVLFAGAVWTGLLEEYQLKRITVFLDQDAAPTQAGYNVRQAKIAVGSGGLIGKGLFSGTQSKLRFIPERHADFIFAVLAEEFGFIGSVVLILLYFLLIMRTVSIAIASRDEFGTLVAGGLAAIWLFHIVINIGMNLGIMPVTGIPLPFVSYGGSFLSMNLLAVGVLVAVGRFRYGL